MNRDKLLAELLIFSTLHFVTKSIIIGTTLLILIPFALGFVPFEIAAWVSMTIVFVLGVLLTYTMIDTLLRNT